LRKAVGAARRAVRKAAAAAAEAAEAVVEDDPPWSGPIALDKALTTAAGEIPHYLAAPPCYSDIIPLWSAASHIVQDENIALPIMPQLGFQSDVESAGKSTALEIVKTLAYRGQLRSSYTAATIFRFIHESQITFALSELHNVLTTYNQDMRAIINACHRRSEAFVDRVETLPDGSRKPAQLPVLGRAGVGCHRQTQCRGRKPQHYFASAAGIAGGK
jgi:hypothetical protein